MFKIHVAGMSTRFPNGLGIGFKRKTEGLKISLGLLTGAIERMKVPVSVWGAREESVCDVYMASEENVERTHTQA